MTGFSFFLNSGVISWKSIKQPTVALSSTEAEYYALCNATQEAIHLRFLLKELGLEQKEPTVIFCDNQGAMNLSKNYITHSRTRHIDIKYHFIREHITNGDIQVKYCQTEHMIADIFTKSLGFNLFSKHRNSLGIKEIID